MNLKKQTLKEYYDITLLLQQKCNYNMLIGVRSNGKSYQVKKVCLWEAYTGCDYLTFIETGEMKQKQRHNFAYIRRWETEIKGVTVEEYFSDMYEYIKELTNNEYNYVSFYRSEIYLAKIEEDNITRGPKIGRSFALNSVTHYKSLAFPNIGNLIYEEFITNSYYLARECESLFDLVSTIARRDFVRIFMVGNTVGRDCPYFLEWQLTNIMKQKPGTIDIYDQHTGELDEDDNEIIVKVAVEYCNNTSKSSKVFFGQKSKMITTGAWESEAQPKLESQYNSYKCVYKILCLTGLLGYMINLLIDPKTKQPFLYVYPSTNRNNVKRIISDEFSSDKFLTNTLTPLTKYDIIVLRLINQNKICFSDNLTGTEFKNYLKMKGW